MFGYKVYNTVVMDGSSKFVNREIAGMIDMTTRRRFGRSKCRRLNRSHPTIIVIRRFTSSVNYWKARKLIESFYPGVCNFDVPM